MTRIVFLGTSDFSVPVLEALVAAHEVVAVYTQPDRPSGRGLRSEPSSVKRKAVELGLPVLQPARLREPGVVDVLSGFKAEVVVVAAYGQILPNAVLAVPPKGCLNVHPSLLPRYRGPSPIQASILSGDPETGVTVMLMDEGMDSGPLLAQRRYELPGEMAAGALTRTLAHQGSELLLAILPSWLDGKVMPHLQAEAEVTFCHMFTKADGAINWGLSALELDRRVRAFNPWPGCFTSWRGRRLLIHEAIPFLDAGGGVPGRVVATTGRPGVEIGVETGQGVLGLVRVQLEGKRPMLAGEFVRGQRDFLGAVLPGLVLPRL